MADLSLSDLNLYFQLCIIIGLTIGLFVVKRKKLVPHGWLMLIMTILNIGSIIVVMIPVIWVLIVRFWGSTLSIITVAHMLFGLIVLAQSGWILYKWRFQKPGVSCFRNKNLMMRLFLFWVAEVVLGVSIYYQLYV